jgi:hypothetical protein
MNEKSGGGEAVSPLDKLLASDPGRSAAVLAESGVMGDILASEAGAVARLLAGRPELLEELVAAEPAAFADILAHEASAMEALFAAEPAAITGPLMAEPSLMSRFLAAESASAQSLFDSSPELRTQLEENSRGATPGEAAP